MSADREGGAAPDGAAAKQPRARKPRFDLLRVAGLAVVIPAIMALALTVWTGSFGAALNPAEGVSLEVVTRHDTLEAVGRAFGMLSETRPCAYELLGWGDDGSLYFRSDCRRAGEGWWQAIPGSVDGAQPIRAEDVPDELLREEVPPEDVLAMVRVEAVQPSEAEPSVRRLYLAEQPALRSPDGRAIAAVSQFGYGPQDVILLSPEG